MIYGHINIYIYFPRFYYNLKLSEKSPLVHVELFVFHELSELLFSLIFISHRCYWNLWNFFIWKLDGYSFIKTTTKKLQ